MRTDVLVIGGGLTGTATAYFLARGGADVLLLERFDLNTQASGCNAGSIHAQIPHEPFVLNGESWARAFAPTIPLMMDSIALWSDLQDEIGPSLGVTITGGLIVAETESQFAAVRAKAALERQHGLPVDVLDRQELRTLAPYIADRMIGGAFCPVEGKANPLQATAAIAAAAQAAGARVLTHVTVTGIAANAGGFRVQSSAGEVCARRVVNCAGAAAADICRMVGVDLPLQGYPIQVNVTEPAPAIVSHLVYFAGEKLSLKQTAAGSILIGGGWPARQDPVSGRLHVEPHSVAANLAVACHVVPALRGVNLLRTWPAVVNGTADWRPVIGETSKVPGFYLASFPWLGFTAGPITARLVSDLILGRRPSRDISAFAPIW